MRALVSSKRLWWAARALKVGRGVVPEMFGKWPKVTVSRWGVRGEVCFSRKVESITYIYNKIEKEERISRENSEGFVLRI